MLESAAAPRPGASSDVRIAAYGDGRLQPRFDRVAVEEPLEIRLRAGGATRTAAITMRTPGNDFELAAGFLYGEGIIASLADLAGMSFCLDDDAPEQQYNIVTVDLARQELPELAGLDRHFMTTSACGVCGQATLDALRARGVEPVAAEWTVAAATLLELPERLRAAQGGFAQTGGLHAAGLFGRDGAVAAVREDVGRHNALDKLVGWALLQRKLPLADGVLMVSGRTSYEIVQKALCARLAVVCAVSAPSSLAVSLAREFGVTLVGFLRDGHFNAYSGAERIVAAA
jgi:FdhD protein